MMNSYNEQFYKIQLKWASDNFDAEHRMRMAADQRAAGARGLLMDVVVHLLASELDDVRKKEDVALWTDAQLVRWMKDTLSRQLRQLRAVTGAGAQRRFEQAAQEIRQLKAENAQLNQHVLAEAKRAATYQATIADQRQQIERLQQANWPTRDDLDIARSQAARSAAPSPPPVIIEMPVVEEPFVPPPAQETIVIHLNTGLVCRLAQRHTPSAFERQQRIIEVVGRG